MNSCSEKETILVVDDNANTLEVISRNLVIAGYQVIAAQSVVEAIESLRENAIDLIVTDNKMPHKTGIELVKFAHDNYSKIGIIMVTGYSSIDGAISAVKEGVSEYLTKPFTDEELLNAVENTIKQVKAKRMDPAEVSKYNWKEFGIIGDSKKMLKLRNILIRACSSDATVLITGESGTGKELVARAMHYGHAARSIFPFIPVNCPGIPENLFESELFGHVKGAFTGASQSKVGFFNAANKGSVFLDEISEISLGMQSKLLRVLQEKEINVVGKPSPEKIDTRIIAATNRDLEQLVQKGQFREDLYFRLNVINIEIPPLREREDDVILLANYFAHKYSAKYGKSQPTFSSKAIAALKGHNWPGNIRELENIVQRCIVLCDEGEIDSSDFPEKMRYNLTYSDIPMKTLGQIENEYIKKVIAYTNSNKSKAASILGIDRKTLREKLKIIEGNHI